MQLLKHQQTACEILKRYNAYALFMDMGTGKTITMLSHIKYLIENKDVKNVLIVAPKSTMASWLTDIDKFDVLDTEKLNIAITVINYDKVWRDSFEHQKWDCIVLDESHFIKNRSSKRGKFLINKALECKYRYILTGTPINNGRLEEIYAQLTFLYPKKQGRNVICELLGLNYYQFLDRYAVLDQFYKPYRYLRVDELQDIINSVSFHVKKDDVLNLPTKHEPQKIDVLSNGVLYYKIAKNSCDLEHNIYCENAASKLIKLRQICSGFVIDYDNNIVDLNTDKIDILKELITKINDRVVIFCDFRYSITKVSKLLESMKLKHLILNGDTKDKSIWQLFQKDDSYKAIILQYTSGSQGINLYKCNHTIYYEPTLSSNLYEQSKDRTHRNGQTKECFYYNLCSVGTIEEHIYKALSNYKDFNSKLFDEYIYQYRKQRLTIR